MSEKKRQHPIVIITGLLGIIKDWFVLPVLIALIIRYTEILGDFEAFMDALFYMDFGVVMVGITLITFILNLLNWFFYSFSYSDGVLNIDSGILIKTHKQITRERIQTISTNAGIIFRFLNLTTLTIESAGESGSELKIALSVEEAESLKLILKSGPENSPTNIDLGATKTVTHGFNLSIASLFAAALTKGNIWYIFALLSVLYYHIRIFLPYELIETYARDAYYIISVVEILIRYFGIYLVVISVIVISKLKFIIDFFNFTIERNGDEVRIKRGLIKKQCIAFKLHRIQAVTVVEGIIRQPLGYAEAGVIVDGDDEKNTDTTIIHPFIKLSKLQAFFDNNLPGVVLQRKVTKLPKRALPRYLIRGVLPFILVVPAFFFIPYGFLGTLVYLPLLMLAFSRYRDSGYFIEDNGITLRFRRIARTTAIISKNRIQSIDLISGYFQRICELKTIKAMVYSSSGNSNFSVKDISSDDGKSFWDWFSWKGHCRSPSTSLIPTTPGNAV